MNIKNNSILIACFFLFLFSCQTDFSSEDKSYLAEIVSLHEWRVKREIKDLVRQAKKDSAEGRHALALGKFRKAYRLAPKNNNLAFEISKQYAWIVVRDDSLDYERNKSLEWLMNAYRANYPITFTEVDQSPLTVLNGMPLYESLKVRLNPSKGKSRDSFALFSQRVAQIQGILGELNVVSQQIAKVLKFFYGLADWLGFQVILFLVFVLLLCVLFRVLGFPFTNALVVFALFLTGLIWHITMRVMSGGASGGWGPILRLMFICFTFFLVFKLIGHFLFWANRRLKRILKTSSIYDGMRRLPPVKPSKELRKLIYDLDEANHELMTLGNQYLSQRDGPNESDEILREINFIKEKIHRLTETNLKKDPIE